VASRDELLEISQGNPGQLCPRSRRANIRENPRLAIHLVATSVGVRSMETSDMTSYNGMEPSAARTLVGHNRDETRRNSILRASHKCLAKVLTWRDKMRSPQNHAFACSVKPAVLRYYLSDDGQTALGPFPLSEVRWMIRHRHFSRDVLIRAEDELSWTYYGLHSSGPILQRALCHAITQFRALRLLINQEARGPGAAFTRRAKKISSSSCRSRPRET
jgi:hypothetical protein